MPKQSLSQRTNRLLRDCADDPTVDLRARWEKIAEDFPAEALALGPMEDATLDDVELDAAVKYAARDADATLRIYPVLSQKIDEMGLRPALELDESVVPIIAEMQAKGMLVDRSHLETLSTAFTGALIDLEYRICDLAGRRFLVTSPDQVAEVLFEDLGLAGGRKTRSGKRFSTDEKTLDALEGQHPIIALLKEHREISKLQGTYVEKLPGLISPDGRIRMELGMTTIPSGRLNCWGGVNLLGIPVRTELGREIRKAFIAPTGKRLGAVDLNQIELRGLAVLSGDEHLLEAYYNGEDLHRNTAADAIYHIPRSQVGFEQRQRGKVVNFAVANQISALGLRDQFYISGITDIDEADCQRMLDGWYAYYSSVQPWYEAVYAEGRRQGYIRCPLSGRILYVPGLRCGIEGKKGDSIRAQSERVATNWLLQVFAQVIGKHGMAQTWAYLDFDRVADPLLYVHDELLVETDRDDAGEILVACMTETGIAQRQPIPILAGYHEGATWADLK